MIQFTPGCVHLHLYPLNDEIRPFIKIAEIKLIGRHHANQP